MDEKRTIPENNDEIKDLTPTKIASIRETGFQAGNRMCAGRPKGVKYFTELLRMFLSWPERYIREVLRDPNQPAGARAAAAQVLLMLSGNGECTDRVLERVEGKASMVAIDIENNNTTATMKPAVSADALKAAHTHVEDAKKKIS